IGTYLITILILQAMGTYRSLISYSQRQKDIINDNQEKNQKENQEENLNNNINNKKKDEKPKFYWNLGTLIAIILLIYEIFQLAVFASYTINATNTNTNTNTNNNNNNGLTTTMPIIGNNYKNFSGFKKYMLKISYISIEWSQKNQFEFTALQRSEEHTSELQSRE